MKVFFFLLALIISFNSAAQIKVRSESPLQYIRSGTNSGRTDAIVVDNVPLVHTKQFLSVNKKGSLIGENNISGQFDQIFRYITQTLNESGSDADKIIKLNIFVTTLESMQEVQSLISGKFRAGKVPSVTFAIGELTHPKALVSIDAIAVSKTNGDRVRFTNSKSSKEASSAILPAGPVVYVSGQAAKGELSEATKATLKQLNKTLASLGLSLSDVVQIKSFLTPMSSLSIVRKEFADFFKGENMPPLVFVEWVSTDPVIEIELVASSPFKEGRLDQIDYITPPGMNPSPVYSKVSRLNYGKKVYLSGIFGLESGNPGSEVNNVFESMGDVLKSSGSSFQHLLKATYYVANDQYSKSLADLRPKYYDPKRPPAASKAVLKGIGWKGTGISIDMIGTIKE